MCSIKLFTAVTEDQKMVDPFFDEAETVRWIVDVIALAYKSLGLQCPIGMKAHSRGMASS